MAKNKQIVFRVTNAEWERLQRVINIALDRSQNESNTTRIIKELIGLWPEKWISKKDRLLLLDEPRSIAEGRKPAG
jgi:hypothetical protein